MISSERIAAVLRPVALTYLYLVLWVILGALAALALGQRPVVVTSGSMSPTIAAGDVVLVMARPRIEPGDIVTFERPGAGLVTHRVVGTDPSGALLTKGDANRTMDPTPVSPDDVVGVTRFAVPVVGRPGLWLHDGAWPAFLTWLAATAAAVGLAVGGRPTARWPRTLASRVGRALSRIGERTLTESKARQACDQALARRRIAPTVVHPESLEVQ